jgi:hypothetical protein
MAEVYGVYRHRKSGHIVRVTGRARLQTEHPTIHLNDMQMMVIYEHDGGSIWIRSEAEFDDGRFERV